MFAAKRNRLVGRTISLWAAVGAALLPGCTATSRPTGRTPAQQQPAAKKSGLLGDLKWPGVGGQYATTFTILCMEGQGPDSTRRIEYMARGLRQVQGLDVNQVRVDQRPGSCRLYYGAYRGLPDKARDQFVPPPQARQDLNLIRSLGTANAQPFLLARIVDAPTPDVGPAEWNLRNAPGLYSLQICYCFDKPGLPNHKEAAAAICKALRDQGEEAWYVQDDRVSVVTVGHFDASATATAADGTVGYGAAVQHLRAKREEFQYNTECLQKVIRVMNGRRIVAPSVLIRIPRESAHESAVPPGPRNPPGHQQPRQDPRDPGRPGGPAGADP